MNKQVKKQIKYTNYKTMLMMGYAGFDKQSGKYWAIYLTENGTTLDPDVEIVNEGGDQK
jgi:hypothetical protein